MSDDYSDTELEQHSAEEQQTEWQNVIDPAGDDADESSDCPLCKSRLEVDERYSEGDRETARLTCSCSRQFSWYGRSDVTKVVYPGTLELEDESEDEE
jgi:hypothetical protein